MNSGWKSVMDDDMTTLPHSHTWELIILPPGKQVVELVGVCLKISSKWIS